jgi:multiple sugar transport system substrate-binding protein
MPRYSIIRDPELIKMYPVFPAVDAIAQKGQLKDWMRPAIPEWPFLADTFGTVFHAMLSGSITPEQATKKVQETMDAKMRENGYY